MRKVILMVLLAVVSSSAMAEWVGVGGSVETTVYVNPSTIRKNGSMVKMWSMYDFKTARTVTGIPYMSSQLQIEYDCKEGQSRGLSMLAYSENMGGGKTVHRTSEPDKWRPIPPSSILEALWKIACKKR